MFVLGYLENVVVNSTANFGRYWGGVSADVQFHIHNLIAMASNLINSDGLQPTSDGLQPTSDGLQPTSDGLQPTSDGLQPASDGLQPASDGLQPNSNGLHTYPSCVFLACFC